jgi:hypothetical protein
MNRETLCRTVLTSLADGVWLATEPVRIVRPEAAQPELDLTAHED